MNNYFKGGSARYQNQGGGGDTSAVCHSKVTLSLRAGGPWMGWPEQSAHLATAQCVVHLFADTRVC
jgi:hypothetical protein